DEHGRNGRHQQQDDDLGLGKYEVVAPGRSRRRSGLRHAPSTADLFHTGPEPLTMAPPSIVTVRAESSANAATARSRCSSCRTVGPSSVRLAVTTRSWARYTPSSARATPLAAGTGLSHHARPSPTNRYVPTAMAMRGCRIRSRTSGCEDG